MDVVWVIFSCQSVINLSIFVFSILRGLCRTHQNCLRTFNIEFSVWEERKDLHDYLQFTVRVFRAVTAHRVKVLNESVPVLDNWPILIESKFWWDSKFRFDSVWTFVLKLRVASLACVPWDIIGRYLNARTLMTSQRQKDRLRGHFRGEHAKGLM